MCRGSTIGTPLPHQRKGLTGLPSTEGLALRSRLENPPWTSGPPGSRVSGLGLSALSPSGIAQGALTPARTVTSVNQVVQMPRSQHHFRSEEPDEMVTVLLPAGEFTTGVVEPGECREDDSDLTWEASIVTGIARVSLRAPR